MTSNPNIVFMMADDMGWGDIGCYNPESRIPTPNMDRLAREGLRFTDAHSSSAVCTPSRYSVMTGRYCWRTSLSHGVIGGYAPPLIEPGRPTLATILKRADYHTACIGKWHIGATFYDSEGKPTEEESDIDFQHPVTGGPVDLGFDYAYYTAGCGTCAPPYGFIENGHFVDDTFAMLESGEDTICNVGVYGQWKGMMGASWKTKDTDMIIADKACEWIKKRDPAGSPFFLYLTPNAPHEPCVERFVPECARGKSQAGHRGDLVWLFDWIVGRVMDTLKARGLEKNTLVIVTSDNGALPGDFALDQSGNRTCREGGNSEYLYERHGHKSCGDWRGYKAHIWEGGHREPLIAWWPAKIAPNTISDQLLCLSDLMATCAAVTGQRLPDNSGEDSFNLLPVLLGKAEQPIRDAVVHHSSLGVFSIRTGDWKLVLDCQNSGGWPTPRGTPPEAGTPGQLYNLNDDPGERNNLWAQRPDVVKTLTDSLQHIRASEASAR